MCFCDSRPLRLLSVLLVGIALTGANCPSECNCLEHEVSCQSKNLKNFPQSLPFHIRYLDISRNQIKYLPLIELSYLTDLVYLNCSYNIIEKISRLPFLNVVKLISLDLSHNHLTTISQMTFQTLKSLTMLWLNNNAIATIEEFSFTGNEGLQQLDISSNALTFLNITSLKELEGLRILLLADNPWICQCNISDLVDWINDHNENFPDYHGAVCSSPEQFAGTPVLEAFKQIINICQNPLDFEDYIFFILVAFGIFIGSIVLVWLAGLSRVCCKMWIKSIESLDDIDEQVKIVNK